MSSRSITSSDLGARGFFVLPEPQRVDLGPDDFVFDESWHLVSGPGVEADDRVPEVFADYLRERHGVSLSRGDGSSGRSVVFELHEPGRIAIEGTTERDVTRLEEQAYELVLGTDQIKISASTTAGLFYGAVTLAQLVRPGHGQLWLPSGVLVDWPDVSRRYVFWDDSEHLDRLDTLKASVRQAALYKANGFVLKLDGHFMHRSAPAVVEPQALSPAELQDLTDYGLRHHVQVIPYIDAPGHLAWVLKHPEYATLREFPDCNYQLCTTDPDAYRLLEGLFDDLLDANRGVDYFVLSTDEPYYVGQGRSRDRAKELGSVGKVEAEFITKAAKYLRDKGRTVQIWGEYPLEREDIPSLPTFLVNGVATGKKYDPIYAAHGLRQLIYASTQGELPNFPDYYPTPAEDTLSPVRPESPLSGLYDAVSHDSVREQDNVEGVFIAAWADAGLHPETFWLGIACGASWAWHPGTPEPDEAIERFGRLFYGPSATQVRRIYELMSVQSRYFHSSWDWKESTARSKLFGDSYEIFDSPRPARDQWLPLPGVPDGRTLARDGDWRAANQRRLQLARKFANLNETLTELLRDHESAVEHNRYNLRVFGSIAALFGQNLELLQDLGRVDDQLSRAERFAANGQPVEAIASLDCALTITESMRRLRNETFRQLVEVWYESWCPRVAEANGRRLLPASDDVKDHPIDRTADMSYVILRQLLLPMDEWFDDVQAARNSYASAHGSPTRTGSLDWRSYPTDGADRAGGG